MGDPKKKPLPAGARLTKDMTIFRSGRFLVRALCWLAEWEIVNRTDIFGHGRLTTSFSPSDGYLGRV